VPLVVTQTPSTSSDRVVELVEDPADPDSLVVPPMLMAAFTSEYVPPLSYDDESLAYVFSVDVAAVVSSLPEGNSD
jgi:hypothetical protein